MRKPKRAAKLILAAGLALTCFTFFAKDKFPDQDQAAAIFILGVIIIMAGAHSLGTEGKSN